MDSFLVQTYVKSNSLILRCKTSKPDDFMYQFKVFTYSFKLTVFADDVILSLCYCFGNLLDNTRVEKKIVFVAIILLNKK